jgi:anti-sigma-K factor RskA
MDPQGAKPNGTPALYRSWAFRATAAVAVVATATAIGLAVWGGGSTRVMRVVLAVRPNGYGKLLVTNLAPAPKGKAYQVWIGSRGGIRSAGLLDGGRGTALVRLPGKLSSGMSVFVTLEQNSPVPVMRPTENKIVFDVSV